MDIATITKLAIPILKRYGVKKAALFGSVVRGDTTPESDIDMLVLPPEDMSLLDFVGLKQDMEDRVGTKVDLVSYNGLSKYLKNNILAHEQVFFHI